ncbi:MAG: hypothetical protein M5R40_21020 [Anaerolineae bacterium]|nr:hypothetical protein [Anaerolineae bacterium]
MTDLKSATSGRRQRVLVVDDDWLNRELIETYLLNADCDVVTAYDGAKALEIATETPPTSSSST